MILPVYIFTFHFYFTCSEFFSATTEPVKPGVGITGHTHISSHSQRRTAKNLQPPNLMAVLATMTPTHTDVVLFVLPCFLCRSVQRSRLQFRPLRLTSALRTSTFQVTQRALSMLFLFFFYSVTYFRLVWDHCHTSAFSEGILESHRFVTVVAVL